MKAILQSAAARILGFVPQSVAALATSYLIIAHLGIAAFSSFSLILTVLTLVPTNNLGVGASLTQAVAAYGVDDDRSRRAALTSARVYAVSSLLTALLAIALGAAGLWPRLLGGSSGANAFVALSIVLYAATFIPSLGQAVLLGTGRNHLLVLLGVANSIVTMGIVGLLVLTGLDSRLVVAVPSVSLLVINLAALVLCHGATGFPWLRTLRRIPYRSLFPGLRIHGVAGPMMVIGLAMPMAFVADRIILSQVSTTTQVARYALVLQIFAPLTGLIVAAAQPLWPIFTNARAQGRRGPGLALLLMAFVGGTFVADIAIVVVADPLGRLISHGRISLGLGLPVLAACWALVQAAAFPLAMSLVDPRGLRVVAVSTTLSVPANVGLAIVLAQRWGAPGPLVSGVIVGTVVQVLPWLVFQKRRSGRQIEVV